MEVWVQFGRNHEIAHTSTEIAQTSTEIADIGMGLISCEMRSRPTPLL